MARGSFLEGDIREALLRMSSRRAVGTMIAQNQGEVLTVSFDKGAIVTADLNEPFAEGLGPLLVSRGVLSTEDLEAVVAARLRIPSEVMAHLLSRDMLSEAELFEGQRSYVFALLVRLLAWERADFKFYDSETIAAQGFRPLSVEELLVRASEEIPGILPSVVPSLGEHAFRKLADDDDDLDEELGPRQQPQSEFLTRLQERILKLVDGATPSIEYVEELGSDEYGVRFAIHRLMEEGLIEACVGPPLDSELGDSVEIDSDLQVGSESMLDDVLSAVETEPESPTTPTAPLVEPWEPREAPLGLSEIKRVFRSVALGWSYSLGAGLAILLMVVVLGGDSRFLLNPLPWQTDGRLALEAAQRAATYSRIERAVTTGHILEGEAPRELTQLVEQSLLAPLDLYDSAGRWLMYGTLDGGFSLESVEGGETVEGGEVRFSIVDDFLLDPAFTRVTEDPGIPALILLD